MKCLILLCTLTWAKVIFSQALPSVDTLNPQYYLLAAQLTNYDTWAKRGGWTPLSSSTPLLKAGSMGHGVSVLRQRLSAENYLDTLAVLRPDSFDHTLTAALQCFQRHNGLNPSGEADAKTIAVLNIGPASRAAQIRINMERWKHLPAGSNQQYVMINAADFRLWLVKADSEVLSMKIIVGRPDRRTPVVHTVISSVIFNPTWTVPKTILKNDVQPLTVKDSSYLLKNKLKLYRENGEEVKAARAADIPWDSLLQGKFAYKLVQDPGPDNALGLIKFLMPNRYNIYLHDTPAKKLFDADQRAFSSGCIRLSNAFGLACALLEEQPHWDSLAISHAIQSHKTLAVSLLHPVPVYVEYLTAWVNKNGELEFRRDIYGRDRAYQHKQNKAITR